MQSSSLSSCVRPLASGIALAATLATAPIPAQELATIPAVDATPRELWIVDRLCDEAGDHCSEATKQKYGFRLSLHPEGLHRGDRVRLFGSPPSEPDLVCWNRCSLYFLDLRPGAHFAHPTAVGLYDRTTGDLQTGAGRWWPIINGERVVFDTLRSRTRASVAAQGGEFGLPDVRPKLNPMVVSPELSVTRPGTHSGLAAMSILPPCAVHAVVVNGYRDEDDTFDEDADGMYQVLRGLGIPDDHIEYLSPFDVSGRDLSTSKNTLEAAFAAVVEATQQAPQQPCDEFVFFLSTHGGTNYVDGNPVYALTLKSRPGSAEWISGDYLAELLQTVGCTTKTIIVEACESGKLEPIITAALAPSTLRYFLSAGHNDLSWADIDENDLNPEDIGSETIWAYIEALGTSSADAAPDGDDNGVVSFDEAIAYAKKHDASWTNRDTEPWSAVTSTLAAHTASPHSCCTFDSAAQAILPAGGLLTKRERSVPEYGLSQVVKRCTNAPLWITVHNVGTSPIPVGTLRVHGAVLAEDQPLPSSLDAFANVVLVTALGPTEQRTYKLHWGVRPSFKKGDRVALFASFDSPLDPAGGPELCLEDGPGASACQADPHSGLYEVSVVKRCFPIVGCNCRKYAPPEPQ